MLWKKTNWYFNGFFSYFAWGIHLYISKKVVVIKIPEWKLKTKIARNTIFEGNYDNILARLRSKIAKSNYFTLVCQSLSHGLGNKYNFCSSEGLKIKILLKEFHILACLGSKCGPMILGQKWKKKAMFIPATSLPTQFSLKEKFLRAIVF